MKITSIDVRHPELGHKLLQSFQETGFAKITNTAIPESLVQDTYVEAKRFFAQSQAAKAQFAANAQGLGYVAPGKEIAVGSDIPDPKEFYHIGRNNPLFPPNPEFQTSTKLLFNAMDQLSVVLCKALSKALNIDSESFGLTGGPSILRLLHYPPLGPSAPPRAIRAAAHEDINLITLLPNATDSGLQIQDKHGYWHDVESRKGDIIVNAGDMLQNITNGYIQSTTHRVINPIGNHTSRYSLPFFAHPASDTDLSPITPFLNLSCDYPRITAGEYLDQRLKEIGLK